MGEREWSTGEMTLKREIWSTAWQTCLRATFHYISTGQTRDRTQAHAVRGRELSAWAIANGSCKIGVLSATGEKNLGMQVAAFDLVTKLITE
jgi:hypothetical protein